jgi:serine/threonine-protein kinase
MRRALGRHYRLEREVGRGGMGVVFLATDLALDRKVAIKVIHPELVVNRALAARFLAEARLIARIRHPHIVSVHSAGEAEGHLYFVMDFLEGETLRQRLARERRLPADVAVSIAAQLAEAVDAAAGAGVVHRDLKPENIFLEGPPEAPRALLTDFGIARMQGIGDGPTGPNAVMGTPAYMSPEQATGEEVDSRSDLYALGIVTYEMLAGEPPFTGPPRIVVSRQIVDAAPPLAELRPDLPSAVCDAVMHALEKIPETRWQRGAAYRRALLGEPTPVSSPPGRLRRRRWRKVAAVAAVALLAVAGLGWSVLGRGGEPRNPRLSLLVLPFDNLREDRELAWLRDGSVSMLALALSQWRDLGVVDQERVHDLLSQARVPDDEPIGLALARRLAREAGAGTVVLGDFTQAGDSLRLTARTYDVASGSRLDVVETAGDGNDDVRPLFDRLAARLLDLSGAPEGSRTSLAVVTTGSLEAYRAYLQGIEHLNHWELVPAAAALRRAVTIDSTFSLAYYKLGLTRGWVMGAGDTVGRNAVLQASRFAGRLPERERSMIDAYRAMLDGDIARSQQLYRALLARDSADADAWYGLADAYFHDGVAGTTPAGMTRSLQAFRRTLELDPQYALAYEHIMALLTSAAAREASYALVGDSFVATSKDGRPALDSVTRELAMRRARSDAVRTARTWVALQPAVARAHHALFEAYFASEDYPSASQEVAELRRLLPASGKDLAGYLEARVRFARGDTRMAAELVRSTTAGLSKRAPELPDFGREFVSDVMAGANPLAYEGDLDGAAEVIALGDAIRRATALTEATPTIWEQDKVWEWSRLAQLYSAAGGPARDLHRVWSNLAAQARRGHRTDQADIAGAGAAAAVGLLLTAEPDPRPVAELEALTGQRSAPGVRALAALARGDSAEARRVLADSSKPAGDAKGSVYLGFAANDPRPLEAEARFQLGDYREAIRLLQSFDEAKLWRRGFDSRWGLLGRIHLLRGLAYERLGQADHATKEFQRVVQTWRSADEPLMAFVQQAQAGLARLRGAVEGRS